MPARAPYERIKATLCMSWGQIALCNKKEKPRIESMSGLRAPAIAAAIISMAQIKARVNDGEKPANHTKASSVTMRRIKVSFLIPALFPKNIAIAENMERCMPESAKMCERPARRKESWVAASVYSRAPQRSARRRPPPLPQLYISLLKCKRHRARRCARRPRRVGGHQAALHSRT